MGSSTAERVRRLFISEIWNVGIIDKPIHTFLEGNRPDVKWLPATEKGCFRADPFALIDEAGRLTLLMEEFDYRTNRGYISSVRINGAEGKNTLCQNTGTGRPVMSSSTHMSYPYLIVYRDEIYCIPETSSAREVVIYKTVEFPGRWEKFHTIVENFALVDPTVCTYGGYWWLFGTDRETGPHSRLYLWYSTDPFGQWREHRANPVKNDAGSSRPAGTPFTYRGRLYRPAQDCSKTYGGRVVINRITRLTTDEFEEETVLEIEPYSDSPYPHGLHTISAAGNITVIDSKREAFDIHCLIKKIRRKISQ